MQLFVVGAPRSGTTIVTQFLNHHPRIKIFDEVDLLQADGIGGRSVTGTLQAFLRDRGVYETFRRCAETTADPLAALRSTMDEIARPRTIWGEKNPRYATRLDALRRMFPEAVVLFVLRDPRAVVNSLLVHRDSPHRMPLDYWIKDSVVEALALMQRCLLPLETGEAKLVVLRYEDFAARPTATLGGALACHGLTFSDDAVPLAHPPPETAGDRQFYRRGAPLPWKIANLVPLRRAVCARDRIDPDDPAWAQVDALARRFGYD